MNPRILGMHEFMHDSWIHAWRIKSQSLNQCDQ